LAGIEREDLYVSETRGRHSAGTVDARPVPAGNPVALEAQIEQTREQLADTIDQIAERVHPRNLARRAADRARSVVVDEQGQIRLERVLMIGGVVVAWVGLTIWRRSR
jgi:uncharacterized protein DUF3618